MQQGINIISLLNKNGVSAGGGAAGFEPDFDAASAELAKECVSTDGSVVDNRLCGAFDFGNVAAHIFYCAQCDFLGYLSCFEVYFGFG